jgi:putative spermidine/putrescine transport system permease protein
MASVDVAASEAVMMADGVPLKARLHRAERRNRLRSLALVVPLLLFIIACFVVPLASMLWRAVDNPEIAATLPKTLAALDGWDGHDVPDEPVYAALAADLRKAQEDRTTGLAGKRLNYEVPGARSTFLRAGRMIDKTAEGPWKPLFIASDRLWGSTDFWATLKRAGKPYTSYYLLTSVDLRLTSSGGLTTAPPDQAIFLDIFTRTLWISFLVTALTLVLGYPIAHLLAILPSRTSNLLMILVLLPFTTSILVRTTSWVVLLQTNGLINDAMIALHLTTERMQLIFNRAGTVLAMTHIQLPFTVLPIYSVMKSIPANHVRAARSLGAGPFRAFASAYMPQTLPGVGAGCLLTFILSLGYYITPALVGGPQDQMVSYFVALYTNKELNWGQAAALGGVLLAITLVLYAIFNRLVGIDKVKLG